MIKLIIYMFYNYIDVELFRCTIIKSNFIKRSVKNGVRSGMANYMELMITFTYLHGFILWIISF